LAADLTTFLTSGAFAFGFGADLAGIADFFGAGLTGLAGFLGAGLAGAFFAGLAGALGAGFFFAGMAREGVGGTQLKCADSWSRQKERGVWSASLFMANGIPKRQAARNRP
jgi:hypothetical protein